MNSLDAEVCGCPMLSESLDVVHVHLSRSSDEHLCSHCCLGTGMRVGTVFVIIVHLWTFASATFSVCVLVYRLSYHDTATSVKDSETGDPQLVAQPSVGRNHPWRAMEKSRRGHSSGTVWPGTTSEILSANSSVHLPSMEARPSTWATSLQKNRRGGSLLRQLKGESRTAAEIIMDDALVQRTVSN